jgi:hypothetical protein
MSVGWDLKNSINTLGVDIYPSFRTLSYEIEKYLDTSNYSDENKGNYKGALQTRVESLTNGINGLIFTSNDFEDNELFDQNVIIDLSRVGSSETKALIMGIMVMKLQEYRMVSSTKNNSCLRHITVLEEAHNLLKRTSIDSSGDTGNLLGKSVEMIANAIAEMRTYGEGFIIADQAPGLLDMSVIRNTNTKIIMRLPDYSDRELVGKAAGLNDKQIEEVAKLKTGVGVVFQNNWISPVLCQFPPYDTSKDKYCNPENVDEEEKETVSDILNIIMKSDMGRKIESIDDEHDILNRLSHSDLPDLVKVKIVELFNGKGRNKAKQLAEIAYSFFNAEKSLSEVADSQSIDEWMERIMKELKPSISEYSEKEILNVLALLVHEHYLKNKSYEPIYLNYMNYVANKYKIM